MWACPLPSLYFLSLPGDNMLLACLLKDGSPLLLFLRTLVLVLSVILQLYATGCPAYCSLLHLSCPLATFSWLGTSCVQQYVYLFPLFVVTLVRHAYALCMAMLSQWHQILRLHLMVCLRWGQGKLVLVIPNVVHSWCYKSQLCIQRA